MTFKKTLAVILLIASATTVTAQITTVGISAGTNNFIDPKIMKGDLNRFNYSARGLKALSIEAGYEGFLNKYKALKVSFLIDHYSGKMYEHNLSGEVAERNYEMKSTRVGIGISPYQLELFRNLILSPALEMNVLAINSGKLYTAYRNVNDSSIGVIIIHPMLDHQLVESKIPRNIYNAFNLAATISLSYKIPFGEKYYIAPNYRYYYGLMFEFKDEDVCVVSRRNQLGVVLGLKK